MKFHLLGKELFLIGFAALLLTCLPISERGANGGVFVIGVVSVVAGGAAGICNFVDALSPRRSKTISR